MPSLHLLPWSRLAPGSRTAGRRVLTPNVRAARALDVEACSLVGHATRRLQRAGAPRVASSLEAQALMLEAVRRAWPGGRDVEGRARGVAPVIRGWLRAGADLAAIEAAGPPRAQAIARIARAYVAALANAGRLDPAQVLRAAAALPGKEDVLVAGYPRLGWDEAAYVEAVAGPGSCVLLPDACGEDGRPEPAYAVNRALAARWRLAGWEVEEAGSGPAIAPAVPVVVHAYADEEAELRGALAAIKEALAAGVPPSACALVARDDAAIGPRALAIAQEYGVPLQLHYRVPLQDTRLGTWLEALLAAAAAGFDRTTTLALLVHPLTAPELLQACDRAALRGGLSGVAAWAAAGVPLALFEPPAGQASAGAWGSWLSGALTAARVAVLARRWPAAAFALQALQRALPTLAGADMPLSLEAFAARLREVMRQVTVPFRLQRGGVSLHTPLALFGARVRRVFVVGVAEGGLPAPVTDNPVLDFHDLAALGALGVPVEDAAGAAGRELTSFAALAAVATETLVLSHPRLRGGKPALPSPFLAPFGPPETIHHARLLASHEEHRRHALGAGALADDALAPALAAALAAERAREGSEPYGPHEGITGVPVDPARHVFSASQLTTLGQCPFRWFAGHVLRLAPPEDDGGEALTERLRGTLYHGALQRAVEAAAGAPALREAVVAGLPEALEGAREALDVPAGPAWERQRPGHLRLLEAAVAAPGFLADGARPIACEAGFTAHWRGLRLTGRIDRIDRDAEGRLVLVDYKTGASAPSGARDGEGRLRLDLQLPIYVEAAAPRLYPGDPVGEAVYYSLSKAEPLEARVPAAEALDAFVAAVRERLAAGAFPVAPDPKREACTWCDHRPVCRVGPGHERKHQPEEDPA
jgi:RecB family exonuclease